jgi:uncharacterized protein with WD repeat
VSTAKHALQPMTTPDEQRWGCTASQVIRRLPAGSLRDSIASMAVIDRHDGSDHVFVLPDSRATLLFHIVSGTRINKIGGFKSAEGNGVVLGAATKVYSMRVVDVPVTIVVKFRTAGSYQLLQLPMRTLTDRCVDLRDIWGGQAVALTDALLRAHDHEQRLILLERFFNARLEHCSERASRTSRIVAAALHSSEQPPSNAGSVPSPRHLRRLVGDVVGLNPCTLWRIERFNRAMELAQSSTLQWEEVAAKAGYYDQAHMIGEFKHFTGFAPGAFLRALHSGVPHLQSSWFSSKGERA